MTAMTSASCRVTLVIRDVPYVNSRGQVKLGGPGIKAGYGGRRYNPTEYPRSHVRR